MDISTHACPLCSPEPFPAVWADPLFRVIRVRDLDFPAYYRVISNRHVPEFSALEREARHRVMELVATVESTLLAVLAPAKVNLASLGNLVPHLHWHVIARFDWDSRFPQPIWAPPQRALEGRDAASRLACPLPELDERVHDALSRMG